MELIYLMGKTTLYHPISLNVIRGAAEFQGFKFGKIQQLGSSFDKNEARYRAVILQMPEAGNLGSPKEIKEVLQGCFMNDIDVTGVWYTKRGEYIAELKTRIVGKESE